MKNAAGFSILTLHVEGVTLDNLELDDIAEYLTDFAKLIGTDSNPRFHSIRRGSLSLKARVPADREIDVKTRAFLIRTGDAPEDAIKARDRISRRLCQNRGRRATLLDSGNAKVIEIPVHRVEPAFQPVPPSTRAGTLQGQIIRLGGKQETVSVELQDVDGHIYLCKAPRSMARKLAREMFEPVVRVHGSGRWSRGDDGVWRVEEFQIADFEVLEDDSLIDVVAQLRGIRSKWKTLEDPAAEMEKIRNGEPELP
ncbi:MAG: hypothetical protein U0Q18_25440 [Bryobacteraceae bacterium]